MPKLLVVDDTAVDLCLMEGVLSKGTGVAVETATSGREALQLLESLSDIDAVITDLTMPDMNGLELVNQIRLHYPDVPVILTTAHGSEELAVEALESGAASYVPKSQLAESLLATVESVLAMAVADQAYERLSRCMEEVTLKFRLDNDPALADKLTELVRQMIGSMDFCDTSEEIRLGTVLTEGLRLAALQGNLELTADEVSCLGTADVPPEVQAKLTDPARQARTLHVQVELSRGQAKFAIQHEGPGLELPAGWGEPGSEPGSESRAEALHRPQDRGAVLIRAFTDEVTLGDGGRTLIMIKRCASHDETFG